MNNFVCCGCGVEPEGNISIESTNEHVCDKCHEEWTREDDVCPTCKAQPGDGYTAFCHDMEGCGYYKKYFGALSDHL
jgi:hypothetical protein